MPTIIDSLVILLGLDATGFKKGQADTQQALKKTRDEATTHGKEMRAQAKQSAEVFNKFKNEVLGLAAAFVGMNALKNFAERVTDSDASVGRLAKNLGVATQELSAWEQVAKRFGSSSSDVDSAFRNTNKIVQSIRLTGNSDALNPLTRAGVNMNSFMSAADDAQRMRLVADAASKLKPQDAQSLLQMAGYSESTVTMLMQGRALDEVISKQKELNAATDQDSKQAVARQQAWADIADTFTGMGRKILDDLTPAILVVMKAVQAFFGFFENHITLTESLVTMLALGLGALSLVKFAVLLQGFAALTGSIGTATAAASGLMMALARLGILGAAAAAGYAVGSGLDWLMGKELSAATGGGETSLGGAAFDLIHGNPLSGGSGGSVQLTDKAQKLANLEQQFGLPAGVLWGMYGQESGYGKNLRSSKGALGPFQFMPKTAAAYGITNPMDFDQEARGAAMMMRDLLRQYHGNLPQALMAYNGGAGGAAGRYSESTNYARSIMSHMGGRYGAGGSSSTRTDMQIGQITVNTQATDAKGIARDLKGALAQQSFTAQANYGVN